jgi:uncharacterized protein (TIGR02271 family)
MDELLASGFSRTDVNVSSADATGQTDSLTGSTLRTDETHEEGIGASIKHFFTGLFGSDNDEHATRYSDAVSRGHHVLTLTTSSEPEVERAADVIERFGPVDIDERHDLSGSAASLGATAYQPQSSSSMSSAGSMQSGSLSGSSMSGTQPGALQGSGEADKSMYFGTQDMNDTAPRDMTFQESQAGSLQSDMDESLRSSGGNLQGTSSLQGSDDASLGGTIRTDQSLQRDTLSGSSQRDLARETGTTRAIPVVEEELKVGKREVQRGGVRVFSRVVETPVNESVNLREEHVSVERRPVNQPISTADATAFKEQSIELRESAEEAVVQKSARVVEEVLVGKEVTQRQQNISDTVRHTEVQVENLAGDDYYRKHYTSNYASAGGSFDDYAPAYSYGSDMRRQYSGRNWDDVESDLRTNWDSRNSGQPSTWEKMKAAVRHGWDKITPDMDDDDSYYRNHWTNTYGTSGDTYNDYQPAYRYGNEMRSSSKYKGRNWDDVESDLRSDWDTRYPSAGGVSTWDKMKAAVRHGWDRMTS